MTGKDPSFGSLGFHQLLFTIQEITAGYAYGTDQFQVNRKIPVAVQRAKGAQPSIGEQWLITKDLGPWTFAAIMNNPSEAAGETIEIADGGFAGAQFPTGSNEAVLIVQNPDGYEAPGFVSGPFTGGNSLDGPSETPAEGGLGYASLNLDASNNVISGAWEWVGAEYNETNPYSATAMRALEANAQIADSNNFVEGEVYDVMQSFSKDSTANHYGLAYAGITLDSYWDHPGTSGEADYQRDVYVEGFVNGLGNAYIYEYLQSEGTASDNAIGFATWQVGAGSANLGSQQYVAASIFPDTGSSWFVLGQYEDGVPAPEDNYILGQPSVAMLIEDNDAALFVVGQDTNSVPYTDDPSAGNFPAVYRGAVSGQPGSGGEPYSNMPMHPGSVYPDLTDGAQGLWVVDITETPAFVGAGYYGITSGNPGTAPPSGSMMSDQDGSLWVYNGSSWNRITITDDSPGGLEIVELGSGNLSIWNHSSTGGDLVLISDTGNVQIAGGEGVNIQGGTGSTDGIQIGATTSQTIGFYSSPQVGQQTVTGSQGGNTALASLLSALNALGLIVDGTTP